MKLTYGKTFARSLRNLNDKQIKRPETRLSLWVENPNHPSLRDHALRGSWAGHRSINVGGDLRLIYKYIGQGEILVVTIGTHAQLYD